MAENKVPAQNETAKTAAPVHKASEPAGGLFDNVKGLDFARIVVVVEDGARDAIARDWFGLLKNVGELAVILGKLGAPVGELKAGAAQAFTQLSAAPDQLARFDAAADNLERARGESYAIPPMSAGPNGPAVAFDPATILVALELFKKLADVVKVWRARKQ